MKAINMIKIYRKYKGEWVAIDNLKRRKVIAHGKTLKQILDESKKKGIEAPMVTRIPKEILPLVGSPKIIF
ncbi:hypothetical protein HYZ70_03330 [Candidatus Curtissbacteria bacterium]|nr:hypothetical protein [Candidatus Curtissbacteria bacterium]